MSLYLLKRKQHSTALLKAFPFPQCSGLRMDVHYPILLDGICRKMDNC